LEPAWRLKKPSSFGERLTATLVAQTLAVSSLEEEMEEAEEKEEVGHSMPRQCAC
jgi:hypothetical protein